jgi:hypothetical protein
LTFRAYAPYLSQPGGQALLFSLLDAMLNLPPEGELQLFYGVASGLSALAFTRNASGPSRRVFRRALRCGRPHKSRSIVGAARSRATAAAASL